MHMADLPPLRLGFAEPPLPHFVVERTGARLDARPLHPERGRGGLPPGSAFGRPEDRLRKPERGQIRHMR